MFSRLIVGVICALALLAGGYDLPSLNLRVELQAQQKTVKVKGYTKKDGTYVEPHTRSAPRKKAASATPSPPTAPASAKTSTASSSTRSTGSSSGKCETCPRDENGRIVRSETVRRHFMKLTGFPEGRSGYLIDHIIPLACGGPDTPYNMQWQTVADAKAKDKVERDGCR